MHSLTALRVNRNRKVWNSSIAFCFNSLVGIHIWFPETINLYKGVGQPKQSSWTQPTVRNYIHLCAREIHIASQIDFIAAHKLDCRAEIYAYRGLDGSRVC